MCKSLPLATTHLIRAQMSSLLHGILLHNLVLYIAKETFICSYLCSFLRFCCNVSTSSVMPKVLTPSSVPWTRPSSWGVWSPPVPAPGSGSRPVPPSGSPVPSIVIGWASIAIIPIPVTLALGHQLCLQCVKAVLQWLYKDLTWFGIGCRRLLNDGDCRNKRLNATLIVTIIGIAHGSLYGRAGNTLVSPQWLNVHIADPLTMQWHPHARTT